MWALKLYEEKNIILPKKQVNIGTPFAHIYYTTNITCVWFWMAENGLLWWPLSSSPNLMDEVSLLPLATREPIWRVYVMALLEVTPLIPTPISLPLLDVGFDFEAHRVLWTWFVSDRYNYEMPTNLFVERNEREPVTCRCTRYCLCFQKLSI